MPDAAQADPKPPAPAAVQPYPYKLVFEPVGDFSEAELFIKGFVSGKIWLSDKNFVIMRSLIGTEVDEINEKVKVTADMTVSHFNTEITYNNLARSIKELAGKPFDGTVDEKLSKIRGIAGPILARLSMAYLEFGHHVDELFVGKEGGDTAKKS